MVLGVDEAATLLVKMKEAYAGPLEKMVGDYKKSALVITGALSGVGATLFTIAKQTANLTEELGRQSQITNVNVKELSKLREITERSGVQSEKMYDVLKELNVKMLEAKNGSGTLREQMEALGIQSVTTADGQLRPTLDVFQQIVVALSQMEDGAKRTAIADEIFSDSGTELLPVLLGNTEAIKNLKTETDSYFTLIDQKAVETGSEFNKQLRETELLLQGTAITVGNFLLPKFKNFIADWQDGFKVLAGLDNAPAKTMQQVSDEIDAAQIELEAYRMEMEKVIGARNVSASVITSLQNEINKRTMLIGQLQQQRALILENKQAETGGAAGGESGGPIVDPRIERERRIGEEILNFNAQLAFQLRDLEAQNVAINDENRQTEIDREIEQYMLGFDREYQAVVMQNERVGRSALARHEYQERLRQEDLKRQKKYEALRIGAAQDGASALVSILEALNTISQGKHKDQFEFLKGVRYVQALVNTYAGANQALASVPYPYNLFAAASVIAAGIANVAAIHSQNFSGGGTTPSIGSGTASTSGAFDVQAPTTVPAAQPDRETEPTINIVINNPRGDEDWQKIAEEDIAPAFRELTRRNIATS